MDIWRKWIYPGVVTTAALTLGTVWFKSDGIEHDISNRVQGIVGDWANVEVDGRDVILKGAKPEGVDLPVVLRKIGDVEGVRLVSSELGAASGEVAVADAEEKAAKEAAEAAAKETKEAEMLAVKAAEEAKKAQNEDAKKAAEAAARAAEERVKQAEAAETAARAEANAKELAAKEAQEKIKAEQEAQEKAAAAAKLREQQKAEEYAAEVAKLNAEKEAAEQLAENNKKQLDEVLAKLAAQKPIEGKEKAAGDGFSNNPQYYIEIRKSDFGLEVSGITSSEAIRTKLIENIKKINPNIEVDETLIIDDQNTSKFEESVAFGMAQLERLSEGQVIIESSSVDLLGNAKSLDNYEAVYEALKDKAAADLNVSNVNVKAPKISPYLFGIDYDGDKVHLTGFVPNEEARSDVKAIMQTTFPGIEISEELQIASGEPERFLARIKQASAQLSLVPKGTASLIDGEVEIDGTAAAKAENKTNTVAKTDKKDIKEVEKKSEVKAKPVRKFKLAENQTCQELFDQLLSSKQVDFKAGKAAIEGSSLPVLKTLVRISERCPSALLQISGHTDSDGDNNLNQALSLARAKAVRAYLTKNGISGGRILAVGYGEKRPIASNVTAEGKKKNRRIEFYVIEQ